MATTIEGQLVPPGDLKIGIVVARFNDAITTQLLDGALDGLRRHGVPDDAVTVAKVPGSFEIPLAAKELAMSQRLDAIICLGCVIRGDTRHFELVADGCAAGVRQVSLDCRIPLIFAVLTVENAEQAADRAGLKMNRGREAAAEAIEMANLMRALREDSPKG
ncbi:MAG TPA: 6,7-dimethyl-8-ribityllumazine synthase [Chloroflexota bacterium]|nr:6,7-dimethyl-8-ribityllumazine synthase [Chloroflexota bacterium]